MHWWNVLVIRILKCSQNNTSKITSRSERCLCPQLVFKADLTKGPASTLQQCYLLTGSQNKPGKTQNANKPLSVLVILFALSNNYALLPSTLKMISGNKSQNKTAQNSNIFNRIIMKAFSTLLLWFLFKYPYEKEMLTGWILTTSI